MLKSNKICVCIALFFTLLTIGKVSYGQEEIPTYPKGETQSNFQVTDYAFCPESEIDSARKWCRSNGSEFSAEIGRLYCYTKIFARADSEIYHNWIFEGERVSSVKLKILRSGGYRTRSYKTIPQSYAGDWKVEVVADGEIIKTLHFTISPLVNLPHIGFNR